MLATLSVVQESMERLSEGDDLGDEGTYNVEPVAMPHLEGSIDTQCGCAKEVVALWQGLRGNDIGYRVNPKQFIDASL